MSKTKAHAAPHFTVAEYRREPAKVMAALEKTDRVIVMGDDGQPRFALSRQAIELK